MTEVNFDHFVAGILLFLCIFACLVVIMDILDTRSAWFRGTRLGRRIHEWKTECARVEQEQAREHRERWDQFLTQRHQRQGREREARKREKREREMQQVRDLEDRLEDANDRIALLAGATKNIRIMRLEKQMEELLSPTMTKSVKKHS
jgi:hypothetical protein